MIEKNKVIQRRHEIAELRHADGVFRDIQARVKERENYEQRWFWELLQNAKDAVEEGEVVQVQIIINNDTLTFAHTGNPFDLDDILSLIIQGSSKAGKEGKDGRFGTGFMTTYLLSKHVTITGSLLNDEGYFHFLLNREGNDNDTFFQNQVESRLSI